MTARRGLYLRILASGEKRWIMRYKRGHVVPAVVADHVVPHKGDFTSFRLGALRSLCKACHDSLDRTK